MSECCFKNYVLGNVVTQQETTHIGITLGEFHICKAFTMKLLTNLPVENKSQVESQSSIGLRSQSIRSRVMTVARIQGWILWKRGKLERIESQNLHIQPSDF